MAEQFTIVGIGEALFDIYPDDRKLGGAPLNLAVHAHQLGQVCGGRGIVVSRIGQDELGSLLLDDLRQRGMSTDYIETDPDRPTGRVYVDFDEQGRAQFDIVRDAAWDVLQFDPDLEVLARHCDAVCFSSIAQRDAQSRNSLYRFLDTCDRNVRMFDVNLRPNLYDQRIVRRSCEIATIVKLSEMELPIIVDLLGLDGPATGQTDAADSQAEAMLKRWGLDMVVLTRGERGTRLFTPRGRFDGEPASYPPTEGADSVGAGDACAAGILVGRVLRLPPAGIATLANHLAAHVASQPGATPALPDPILDMVKH